MARQPDADRDKAEVAVEPRDVTQAVGAVREPVQEDDRSAGLPVGLKDIGTVPVLREGFGIDQSAEKVAA